MVSSFPVNVIKKKNKIQPPLQSSYSNVIYNDIFVLDQIHFE